MPLTLRVLCHVCALTFLWAWPTLALAQQTTYVPADEIKRLAAAQALLDQQGGRFGGTLSASASLSFASNDDVVGQVDGNSTLIGVGILGGLDYVYRHYEMRNTLKLDQAWSRTPVIDEFIKTNDILQTETLHHYFLLDWAGVFGRVELTTNLLETEDVRAEPVTYALEGTTQTTDRFELNGAFDTISLHQALGVFAEPIRTKPLALSLRLGAGGRQTFAKGVFVVADDAATPAVIELQALEDVYQAGLEGFLGVQGELEEGRVGYTVGLTAMMPFLNNDSQDRSPTELVRVAAQANLTLGVFSWLNVVYNFTAIKDPQLVDLAQIQNTLLISLQYTLIDRSSSPPTPEAAEIEAAKAAAAAADKKAQEAEEKAEAAEERIEAIEEKVRAVEEKVEETGEGAPAPEPRPEARETP